MISGDIKEKDLVNYLIKLDNPDLLTSVTKDLMKVKLFYNGEEKNRADKVIKIISDIKKGRLSTTKNKTQVIYPDKQVASSLMAFLNNNRARV